MSADRPAGASRHAETTRSKGSTRPTDRGYASLAPLPRPRRPGARPPCPYYLTLYYGTEERAFGHRDARPVAWVYAAAVLAGFRLSVPYWRALGLVTG